jgi:hypothetical protein
LPHDDEATSPAAKASLASAGELRGGTLRPVDAVEMKFCRAGSGIGCSGLGIGFDNYIDFRVLFQLHFLAVLIFQCIVDANLFVEVIGVPDFDLRLFRQAGVNWLNNFPNPAWFNGFWLFMLFPLGLSGEL